MFVQTQVFQVVSVSAPPPCRSAQSSATPPWLKYAVCVIAEIKRIPVSVYQNKGVRQGDPLSPTLLNIFINDLFTELRNGDCDPVSLDKQVEREETGEGELEENIGVEEEVVSDQFNALAYADDIVLLSTSQKGLQKALDITEKYCEKWRLTINHSKTKSMVFSKGNQKIKASFKMNGIELENVKEFKYLGITIHKKLCQFTPTLEHFKIKATRALYALRAKININSLPI